MPGGCENERLHNEPEKAGRTHAASSMRSQCHRWESQRDEVSCIDIVYICRDYHGQLKADPGEVMDLAFFRIDSLPAEISLPNKCVFRNTWMHGHSAADLLYTCQVK